MDLSFIRDPATVRSRVYVGGLADGTTRQEMEEYFQKYGNLVGVVVNRGFGFIQFLTEEEATMALKDKGGMIHGKKIFVKPAQAGVGSNARNVAGAGQGGGAAAQPATSKATGVWDQAPPSAPDVPNIVTWGNYPPRKVEFSVSLMSIPPISYPTWMVVPGRNDCEIIVVSKALTTYAEAIEAHLKRLGLAVDLLYPNDDVPIGKVLGNISSRGCLYAVLVTPQNEEHRSITVNILYGQPAEHRNMPVEDAIKFIAENFREKIQREVMTATTSGSSVVQKATPIAITAPIVTPALTDRHPEAIQAMINLLADNRMLTVLQYDKIIKYISERRELQIKMELGEEASSVPPLATAAQPTAEELQKAAEAEMQQKILSILNKPSITSSAEIKPPLAKDNPHRENTIRLLQDPKVQKALDTVLKSTLLQSLDLTF